MDQSPHSEIYFRHDGRLMVAVEDSRFTMLMGGNRKSLANPPDHRCYTFKLVVLDGNTYADFSLDAGIARMMNIDPADNFKPRDHIVGLISRMNIRNSPDFKEMLEFVLKANLAVRSSK